MLICLGVGAGRYLGGGDLGSSLGFLLASPFFFFRVTSVHPPLEHDSPGFWAGFDTSTSASFSGFSFVVSVVWMFFWGQTFANVADLFVFLG